jgi:glycosyltransferase involved in cell wall biosynthesis
MTTEPTRRFKILTTYPPDVTEAAPLGDFPQLQFVHRSRPARPLGMLAHAARDLWWGDFDGILAEGGYEAFAFALFKRLFFRRGTRLFVNMVYFHRPPEGPLRRLIFAARMSILRAGVDRFLVLSSDEVESYHEVLGIERHKLQMTPYKYNAEGYLGGLEATEGDFLYSGGDSIRDYETLFEAVRPLPVRARILTHLKFPAGSVPENVEIVDDLNTSEEYFEPCARSMFAVVPILDEHLRSSGQSTYLGAMAMGKAVIVSDTPGVRDLIEDGTTGLLCRPGDVLDLRAAIERLLLDGDLRRRIGAQARRAVLGRYTHSRYWRHVFRIMADAFAARDRPPRGAGADDARGVAVRAASGDDEMGARA